MRALIAIGASILTLFSIGSATAAEIKDMLGKWTWQKFTIEVTECAGKRVCAKVIAGPKNVGLEIFSSDLTSKNGEWFGQIVDPETGAATELYRSERKRARIVSAAFDANGELLVADFDASEIAYLSDPASRFSGRRPCLHGDGL